MHRFTDVPPTILFIFIGTFFRRHQMPYLGMKMTKLTKETNLRTKSFEFNVFSHGNFESKLGKIIQLQFKCLFQEFVVLTRRLTLIFSEKLSFK